MAQENKPWYKKWWAIALFVVIGLIIISSLLPNSSKNNTSQSQPTEQKQILTAQQILDARQNYDVVVNDWLSTDWESHYNPNTEKTMSSFWTKLDLSVKNNNQDVSLDLLTIRVNIKHPAGSDGKDISWGRLPLDVSKIKPEESKTMTVYYPGDLSQVTVMQEVYTTIESDIPKDNYRFFKELKSAVTSEESDLPKDITINLCEKDPENADYWIKTNMNLFDKPAGVKVGEVPSCTSEKVEVLESKFVDGVEFYKVKWTSIQGWQTKRLLLGETE